MTDDLLAGIRVVVYEDEGVQRRRLVRLLEDAGAVVVGETATPEDFRRFALRADFDVAILDISSGRMSATRWACASRYGSRPTLIRLASSSSRSVADDESYALHLLDTTPDKRAKGVGYLVKSRIDDDAQIPQAVLAVHNGDNVFDNEVQNAMLQQLVRGPAKIPLTDAELDILTLMEEALTTQAIADRASLAKSTVDAYISSIFRKLGMPPNSDPDRSTRVAAVVVRYIRSMEKYQILRKVEPMNWPPPRPTG